jgi:hypothetical protein
MNAASDSPEPPEAARRGRWWRKVLVGLGVVALVVAALWVEENWRGERAWQQCKHELEAKGEVLDWKAYIPPPVPADQNFMRAPLMDAWFRKGYDHKNTNELARLSRLAGLTEYGKFIEGRHGAKFPVVELQVWPALATDVPSEAYPCEAFATEDVDVLRRNLSRAGQLALLSDPRNGPLIVGGGAGRQPRRAHVRLDATHSREWLERKLQRSFFKVEPTGEPSVLRVVCEGGVLAEDAVAWFDQFQAEFEALYLACQRPRARLEGSYEDPAAAPIPNYVGVRTVFQALSVRIKANLLIGQPDTAMRDLRVMAQLMKYQEDWTPTLVAAMIRVAVAGLYVDTLGEGLAEGLWPERHWEVIQEQLRGWDLLKTYAYAMRGGERAGMLKIIERFKAATLAALVVGTFKEGRGSLGLLLLPRGWHCINQALIARLQQMVLEGVDATNQRIDTGQQARALRAVEEELSRLRPWNRIVRLVVPNHARAVQATARNQMLVNQARVACALERYRQAAGQYPESLEALMPRFLDKLPHELTSGQPLKYRRTPDGRFTLYSVGWNGKDDQGVAHSQPWRPPERGPDDWPWVYVPRK